MAVGARLGTAVAGTAIVMQASGAPATTTANTVAFTAFALVGLILAVITHRPLFSTHARASSTRKDQH